MALILVGERQPSVGSQQRFVQNLWRVVVDAT